MGPAQDSSFAVIQLSAMALNIPMEQPLCLVGNDTGGELTVNPNALEILRGITQPVVVVTIARLYRTGKSYLMNQLAGKRTGGYMVSCPNSPPGRCLVPWYILHPLPAVLWVCVHTSGKGLNLVLRAERTDTLDTWVVSPVQEGEWGVAS